LRGISGGKLAGVTDQYEGFGEMDEVKRQDWGDVADVPVDTEKLRDGGPTRSPGAMTTTGGTGGDARRPRPAPPPGRNVAPGRRGPTGQGGGAKPSGKVAPTTTGDATSGGMQAPTGAATTSDATTGAESTIADVPGRRDR
jgi:hypothetical protein